MHLASSCNYSLTTIVLDAFELRRLTQILNLTTEEYRN